MTPKTRNAKLWTESVLISPMETRHDFLSPSDHSSPSFLSKNPIVSTKAQLRGRDTTAVSSGSDGLTALNGIGHKILMTNRRRLFQIRDQRRGKGWGGSRENCCFDFFYEVVFDFIEPMELKYWQFGMMVIAAEAVGNIARFFLWQGVTQMIIQDHAYLTSKNW